MHARFLGRRRQTIRKTEPRGSDKATVALKRQLPVNAAFAQFENRPLNRKAVRQLGRQPRGIDMLMDIRCGSYRKLAEKLRQGKKRLVPSLSERIETAQLRWCRYRLVRFHAIMRSREHRRNHC